MAAASQPRGPASPRHGSPTASMKARHNNGGLNGLEEEDPLLKDLELNKQPSQKLHSGEERALGKPKRVLGLPASVLAGALYCMASMGMVLLNKIALSSFRFKAPNALLLFQCAVCVVSVQLCQAFGVVKVEPFSWRVVRVWFPVNMIFVGMIGTSFWALQSLNVAMVTVLKNLTNIFTLAGDYYFYGRSYNWGVWGCMVLMIMSALCGAATDLTFDLRGYFWQMMNCLFTASYSLYLRGVMDRVATVTSTGKKLDEFSMVFYNNLLSMPLIFMLMAGGGELHSLWEQPDLTNPRFQLVAALSGLLGFGISFTSLWFIGTTTPTIYSLVGSLNKVPLAFIGLFAFSTPWNSQNLLSIMVGLAAGIVFVWAKSRS